MLEYEVWVREGLRRVLTSEVVIPWNDCDMKVLFSLLAISFFSSSLLAESDVARKEYVLALEKAPLPVKEKFKTSRNMSMPDAKIELKIAGQNIKGTMSNSAKEEAIFDFVSEDEIRVTYLKNRSLQKTVMMGPEKEEEKVDASEGRGFLLEKKEGKWVGKLAEGEVEEEDQKEIDKKVKSLEGNFNKQNDAHIYGTKPRKVGESWDVDPSLMPGMDDFDIQGGKMMMTFLEVKDFEGEPCAVLKTSFTMDGESKDENLEGMEMKLTGSGRIVRSLKYLVDYKFVGEMEMDMKGEIEPQPGMAAEMSVDSSMKIEMRTGKVEEE